MFQKILVANRGEIACRVISALRKLGISSVAVYSEADRDALHTTLADEKICIGPPPSSESYLAIERVLEACRATGAEAVHPGYGFLSENPEFARQLRAAGLEFIGPSEEAIKAMGDKIASKRIARQAGVNTIPGADAAAADADDAIDTARRIGYPIMLKASAGGGGKGMRIAYDDRQCRDGFKRATKEARSSFGDARVFVEKYLEKPRHIEIQVLGDRHGNVIHLGERECSLQRRHQKVIEEAPSPFLDEETRAAMGAQAVALAKAVDYSSAGTVEFIVDGDHQFYFLEMNTRLQVEHPVTECITGLDLVELMIRIAAGEPLPISQEAVRRHGWAIEARLYAEDPFRGFLPSVGRLVRYLPPVQLPGIRIDSGVYEGGEISIHYDPMIAKLIATGDTREEARLLLRKALNQFVIRGVTTNIAFLSGLVDHPRFVEGDLSTNLIAEEYPEGFKAEDIVHDRPELFLATCGVVHRRYRERAARISDQLPGYEPDVENDWVVLLDGQPHPISIVPLGEGYEIRLGDQLHRMATDWQFGQPLFHGVFDEEEICMQVERRHLTYRLQHWAAEVEVMVLSARAAELLARMPRKAPPDTTKVLLSPMPGLLSKLSVAVGDSVKAGQDVAVVEAMKMENVLRAEREGTVVKLLAGVGDTLEVDQPIVEFA